MTDQYRKDLQEFRELWGKLNNTNKANAAELAVQMLRECITAEEDTK